jgi:hypothetical protein
MADAQQPEPITNQEIEAAADRIADGLVAYALRELTDLLGSAVQEAIYDDPDAPEDGLVAWDDLYDAVQKRLRDAGGLPAEVRRLTAALATAKADAVHEAARLLEATGHDDDAINFLDGWADYDQPAAPTPALEG